MTDLHWMKGPPPGRGKWWIRWWNGAIEAVHVGPAHIRRHDPDAALLLCRMGAPANRFDEVVNAERGITHHAIMEKPPGPEANP